jgi:hypothetical protein
MMTISVIVGSTRQGRFSEKPAPWILQQLHKRDGIEGQLLDLRDFPTPFFDQPPGNHSDRSYRRLGWRQSGPGASVNHVRTSLQRCRRTGGRGCILSDNRPRAYRRELRHASGSRSVLHQIPGGRARPVLFGRNRSEESPGLASLRGSESPYSVLLPDTLKRVGLTVKNSRSSMPLVNLFQRLTIGRRRLSSQKVSSVTP